MYLNLLSIAKPQANGFKSYAQLCPLLKHIRFVNSWFNDHEICWTCPADFCRCPAESPDIAGHLVQQGSCRVATSLKKSLKSLNLMPILEILERSLNFIQNFGISLKSPWILEIILEVLEFCPQCDTLCTNCSNRRRYAAFPQRFDILENHEKILELSLNFVDWISWQPWKTCKTWPSRVWHLDKWYPPWSSVAPNEGFAPWVLNSFWLRSEFIHFLTSWRHGYASSLQLLHPPPNKCVNMVCTVTPTVIPPLATYIGILQVFTENSF